MSLLISLELSRDNFSMSVNTAIETQGFTAIFGHSGAGKTTLLRWIAGLESSYNGHLTLNDTVWQDDSRCVPTQQRQIGYVFQQPRLFPHLTVAGNLQFALQRCFQAGGPGMAQVSQWFELTSLLDKPVNHLSGGEQQRVAIARALLSNPVLLLMDEPLASLDTASKERILSHLENLQQHMAIPVLYVSHDINEVSRLADHILILGKGQLEAQGPLIEMSSRLDLTLSHEEYAASILTATVFQQDHEYQLTELRIDDKLPLFITKHSANQGDQLRLRIPARDISLSLDKPQHSSILNIIEANIVEIENTSGARVLVRLQLARQFLVARLTRKSLHRLELTVGQQVYAQIKTVALLSDPLKTEGQNQ